MSTPSRNDMPSMDLPDLAELAMPAPVSLFPQTLAWKLLLVAVVLALVLYLLMRYRRYVRRRWRRQAAALAQEAQTNASSDAWFELIKRVCLVHRPRAEVAALTDAQALEPLQSLDESARQALLDSHHRPRMPLNPSVNEAVSQAFAIWLRSLPDVR